MISLGGALAEQRAEKKEPPILHADWAAPPLPSWVASAQPCPAEVTAHVAVCQNQVHNLDGITEDTSRTIKDTSEHFFYVP